VSKATSWSVIARHRSPRSFCISDRDGIEIQKSASLKKMHKN
jgi:hypothetical protein